MIRAILSTDIVRIEYHLLFFIRTVITLWVRKSYIKYAIDSSDEMHT